MEKSLPEFYFRVRENGAAVFRLDAENRQRRLEMREIAAVNIRNGNIRPHGTHELTPEELAHIRAWMEDRQVLLASRDYDEILQTVDRLNMAAHWAQSRASDEQLAAVTDALLLAMHDLRSTLVRKMAERVAPQGDEA
jgi:predicted SprT family Zn-dependent metalloprotease